MNIHPVGAIFWIAILVWIAWKIKRHFDNQAFARELHEQAKEDYAALGDREKSEADEREKNSINLSSRSETNNTSANTIAIIVAGLLIFFVLLSFR